MEQRKLKKILALVVTVLTMLSSLSFGTNAVNADGTGKYIGWSEYQGSYSAAFYLGKENSTDRYVAYCYNKKREAPPRKIDGTVYYEKTGGTPEEYGKSLYHPITDTGKEEQLIKDLKRVLYHGYPKNASNLLAEFNGTVTEVQKNGVFREVTQWGVWHYTDGFDPEVYYKRDFELASGNAKQINELKVKVYKKLIGQDLQEADSTFEMDLYTTNQTSKETGRQYQNILVTRDNMPLPKPPDTPYGRDDEIYITKVAVVDGIIQRNALSNAKLEIRDGEGLTGPVLASDFEIIASDFEYSGFRFDLRTYGKKFGDIFTLVETEAPPGYKKTEPIVFMVAGEDQLGGDYWIQIKQPDGTWKKQELPDKSKIQDGDMVDFETLKQNLIVYDEKQNPEYDITFKKTNETGNYLDGAEFALYKEVDPTKPIKDFITGSQEISFKLEAGNYILRERSAPTGYVKVEEDIKFTVNDQGKVIAQGSTPEGISFTNNTIECKNKKEVVEETVTLKVKKLWDEQEKTEHPETKFGLFKDKVLQENTVKTLSNGMKEITWENIKKSELQSYMVFELTEKDGKLEKVTKYITLDGKTYEIFPKNTEWQAEENNVYSFTYNNSSVTVVNVEKEWQNKDGEVLQDNLPTITIYISASDDKGHSIREDKRFDTSTKSNDYYIASTLNQLSFMEENVQLKFDEQVEVTVDGKVYLATLTKTDETHYKVVNKEKPSTHLVKISKKAQSETGDGLKGATLKIFNETDDETKVSPIKEWETTSTPQELMLKEGSYKLIESKAPQGYRKAETIHFTVNDDGTIATGGQQLQKGEPIVMVDKAEQTVTIEKKVTGASGDKQKEFDFTLMVNADTDLKTGEVLSAKLYKDGKVSNVNITVGSQYSFKLKDTDKLEVTGLVAGSTYTLREIEYGSGGYTTTVMVNDKEKENADTDTSYTVVNGKNSVVFTNHNGKIVPTGILLDIMPYLVGMTFVAFLGMGFFLSRKRKLLKNARK